MLTVASVARDAAATTRCIPSLLVGGHRVDRSLELGHDGLGDAAVAETVTRLHDGGEDDRHEEDQADVLDRPLPAGSRPQPVRRGVDPAHRLVEHRAPRRSALTDRLRRQEAGEPTPWSGAEA